MENIVDEFDVIIIGAGFGGYSCALKCAQFGFKTAIVEKGAYGGVCLNVGCIPTKTLLKSSAVYNDVVKKADVYGLVFDGSKPSINWAKAIERKNEVIKKLSGGVRFLIDKNKITRLEGIGKAIDKNTVEVEGKRYTGKHLVIATGSVPFELPLPGFDDARKSGFLINSTKILDMTTIPKRLVIIGGGVIGIEFAGIFADLGTQITIIEGNPSILGPLDKDVIKEMTKLISADPNVTLETNAKVKSISGNKVFYEVNGEEKTIEADNCLEAVGRKPVLDCFNSLELELNSSHGIKINEFCETNLENVYAAGDVFATSMLAHVAQHAGIVVANRIARKEKNPHGYEIKMDMSIVPACVYTHPEVAMVGKTEQEVENEGIPYKVFKYPLGSLGKALADGVAGGFVKLIADKRNNRVLGAHFVGHRVTDLIAEIAVAMQNHLTIDEIAETIHPHPTMSEAIGEAAEALVLMGNN